MWQHSLWDNMGKQGVTSQARTFAMLLTLLTFVARAADAPATTLAAATCTALCARWHVVRHD